MLKIESIKLPPGTDRANLLSAVRRLLRIREKDLTKIVLVGDSLFNDVSGGANAGLDTVWYNPDRLPLTGEAAPTCTVSSLLEVLNVI